MAALTGALGLLLLAPLQAPGPPTFTVGVENVSVDVLVTRGGRPVEDLRAGDFALEDNGVRQQVEVLDRSTTTVDAVLVLDVSSSVRGERLSALRRAAHAFVDALWPTDSVGLLAFATDLRLPARAGDARSSSSSATVSTAGAGSGRTTRSRPPGPPTPSFTTSRSRARGPSSSPSRRPPAAEAGRPATRTHCGARSSRPWRSSRAATGCVTSH